MNELELLSEYINCLLKIMEDDKEREASIWSYLEQEGLLMEVDD